MTNNSINQPILFCTRNHNKFREAQGILDDYGLTLVHAKVSLPEIQHNEVSEVARSSARHAFSIYKRSLIVEDTGLYIPYLHGFPGSYAAYVEETIGNQGILLLLQNASNRKATFRTAIAYAKSIDDVHVIDARITGTIAQSIRQNPTNSGWGYDPIFIPEGYEQTFAEMGPEEKNRCSHRHKAFELFATWFIETQSTSI